MNMAKIKKFKSGTVHKDCETFADVARTFGGVGIGLPGRMAKAVIDQERKQAKGTNDDQKHRSTSNDKERLNQLNTGIRIELI